MKLSVMITTYNLKHYVDETLESVVSQEVDFPYEILIGDDGSDDGTIELVKDWEKRYPQLISVYVMDRVQGKKYNRIERASKNRINLIRHAAGDYLIFLDGDDVYTDRYKLKKQVDALEAEENQDCVACAHNVLTYWSEEKNRRINFCETIRKVDGKQYWKRGMYFHSDSLLFRNIFKNGFPDSIPESYYDDNIIAFCLLSHGKLLYLPDTMVNYRQLENSSWNSVDDAEKNIINIMDLDIELAINPALRRESVSRHLYQMYYLWRYKDAVTDGLRAKYLPRLENDRLLLAREWIYYGEKSLGKRLKMSVWMLAKLFGYTFIKLGRILPKNRI